MLHWPQATVHSLHKNSQFYTIGLFIKLADSIKGLSELHKLYWEMENKTVTLHEGLETASPCPSKFRKGFKGSAESK
jgi:hypothetical protein